VSLRATGFLVPLFSVRLHERRRIGFCGRLFFCKFFFEFLDAGGEFYNKVFEKSHPFFKLFISRFSLCAVHKIQINTKVRKSLAPKYASVYAVIFRRLNAC